MIDFPTSPAVGDQVVAEDGATWEWTGTTWDLAGSGPAGPPGPAGPQGEVGPPGPAGPTGPAGSLTAVRMRASLDANILLGQATTYVSNPVPFGKTRATDPSVIDHSAGVVQIKQPGLYLISINFQWGGYHATASSPNTGLVELQAAVVKFADTNANYWILRTKDGMNPPAPVPQVNIATQTISASGTYMVTEASEASPFLLHVELQSSARVLNERINVVGSIGGPSDGQTATSYIEVVRFGI